MIREAATLVSGNVLAQAITLVAYFVLTRIYPPEDYQKYYDFMREVSSMDRVKYTLNVADTE